MLGLLLVTLLVWRVAATTPGLPENLLRRGPTTITAAFARTEEERLDAALARLEAKRGRSRGQYVRLHRAMTLMRSRIRRASRPLAEAMLCYPATYVDRQGNRRKWLT